MKLGPVLIGDFCPLEIFTEYLRLCLKSLCFITHPRRILRLERTGRRFTMRDVMRKERILLVDEGQLFRLWVRQMLESEEATEVIGDCGSAEEAMTQMEALSPNIVIMDTRLPGINGIEACRQLTE